MATEEQIETAELIRIAAEELQTLADRAVAQGLTVAIRFPYSAPYIIERANAGRGASGPSEEARVLTVTVKCTETL